MRPRVIRKRSDGIVQIRRRRPSDALLTRDVVTLVLLMGMWAICTGVLVEALLSNVVLTSMVVLLGTFGVSAAVVTTRLQVEPVRDAPTPPPDQVA
jgi:hypothetical protein